MLRFNRISARGLLNITYIPLFSRLFTLCIITNITSFLLIKENWNCKSIYIYLIALMRVLSWSELFRRTLCTKFIRNSSIHPTSSSQEPPVQKVNLQSPNTTPQYHSAPIPPSKNIRKPESPCSSPLRRAASKESSITESAERGSISISRKWQNTVS